MSAKKLTWKLYRRMLRKLEHRLEPYRRPHGLQWLDDSEDSENSALHFGVAGQNVRLAPGVAERQGTHLPGCAQ